MFWVPFLFSFLFATASFAETAPPSLIAAEFEGFASEDETGVILDVGRSLMSKLGYEKANIKVAAPLRAVKMFFEKQTDCFLGGSIQLFKDYGFTFSDKDMVESEFLYVSRFTLLAPKQSSVQRLQAVAGKKVGVFAGEQILFKHNMPYSVNVQEIKTREQGYKLLQSKRIDFFFDTFPLLPKYFEQVSFSENMVLYRASHRIICHKGTALAGRMTELNREIESLKKRGELSRILTQYYGSNQLRHIKLN